MNQVTAIQERHDSHSRRQDAFVELLYLGVNRIECGIGFGAFAEQDDTFDRVVVVEDFAVSAMDRLPDFAKPDFWPLSDRPEVADVNRRSVLSLYDRASNIVDML